MTLLDLRDEARRHAPALPALSTLRHLAPSARATWLGRMVNEHASARVFEALASQLARADVAVADVEACRGFAEEERRHGVLCGAVVEALGGEARATIPELPQVPRHDDVDVREAIVRNLLSISCMSETVAVALIGAERFEMPEGALRELLTRIWADEIGHASFGWRVVSELLPSLSPEAHARLGRYLAVAFAHVEAHELAHLPLEAAPPPEGVALGLCSGRGARALFYDTLLTVVIPRLEAMGLPARSAWHRSRELAQRSGVATSTSASRS